MEKKIARKKKPARKKAAKKRVSGAEPKVPPRVIKLLAKEELLLGHYSNFAVFKHSKREFVADFFLRFDEATFLVSRIITTPAHAKAIHAALGQNIERYEKTHGTISEE